MSDDELKQRADAVVSEHGGIIPYAEIFYIESIIYASERSDAAFEAYLSAIESHEVDVLTFSLLQEALTHAAAASKFFWPQNGKSSLAAARGLKLRKAFELADDSPLRDRKLRNSLEHFDERLDFFLLEDNFGWLQPTPIVGDEADDHQGTSKRFKLLDPARSVCVILGERFCFAQLRLEIQQVLRRALQMSQEGGRLAR